MAKKRSLPRGPIAYRKVRDPVKPLWMRVVRLTTMILLIAFLITIITGIMIGYYRQLSNHK